MFYRPVTAAIAFRPDDNILASLWVDASPCAIKTGSTSAAAGTAPASNTRGSQGAPQWKRPKPTWRQPEMGPLTKQLVWQWPMASLVPYRPRCEH